MSAPTITIKSPRDVELVTLPIYTGSTRKFTLMSEDYITLKFSLAAAVFFPIGSYVDIEDDSFATGGRFVVTEMQSPSLDTATGAYSYELKMEADYRLWKNHNFKYTPADAGREAAWSLTATPDKFLDLLIKCISVDGFGTYTYEIGSDVKATEVKTLSFSNTNLLDALADIAEQWDTEWYVVDKVIHLGRCEEAETDNPVELKVGDNVESITRSESQNDYATRLFVFGGENNIPDRYRKSLIFDVINIDTEARTIEDTFRLLAQNCFPTSVLYTDETPFVTYKAEQMETWQKDFATGITDFDGTLTETYEITSSTQERNFKFAFEARNFDFAISNSISVSAMSVTLSAKLFDGTEEIEEQEIATKSISEYKTSGSEKVASVSMGAIEQEVAFETSDVKALRLQLVYTCKVTGSRTSAAAYIKVVVAPCLEYTYKVYHGNKIANVYVTFQTGTLAGQTIAAVWNIARTPESCTFTLAEGADVSALAGNQFTVTDSNGANILILGKVSKNYFTTDYSEQMTLNGVVKKRLMLPKSWNNGHNYIDAYDDLEPAEIVETVVCNDDIYPRFSCTETDPTSGKEITLNGHHITAVGTREGTVTNEKTETTEKATFYAIQDTALDFSDTYILYGETLQVQFVSGKLCGLTFDVGFYAKAENTGFYDSGLTGQIFEIVRNEDYGRPLPDATLYPQKGDRYVLLGFDSSFISELLVTDAEKELQAWGLEYMKKLKVDPSTYTVNTMSREAYGYNKTLAELDTNYSLLAQLSVGSRVRLYSDAFFKDGYRDSRIIGYERQLDIPYDSPVFTVGETAAYSRFGELTSDVEELTLNGTNIAMRSGGSTTNGSSVSILRTTDATTPTDNNVLSALRSLRSFLRKDEADTAAELIKFLSGITVGSGKYGIDKNGVANLAQIIATSGALNTLTADTLTAATAKLGATTVTNLLSLFSDGASTGDMGAGIAMFLTEAAKAGRIEVDELLVRNKAIFHELEIRKLSYSGGNIVLSPAGSVIERVTYITADGTEYSANEDGLYLDADGNEVTPVTYRCYYKADDGTTATTNTWEVDDQARCQTFNRAASLTDRGTTENRFYWRRVTAVSDDGYVDLSVTDCADNSDVPQAGDSIVQMGNRTNTDRQGFIYLQSEGTGSPSIEEYVGVWSYTLTDCLRTRISPTQGNLFTGTFQVMSGGKIIKQPVYRGDYDSTAKYSYYDQVTYNGDLWLCIVASGNATEAPSDSSQQWKRQTNKDQDKEWYIDADLNGSEYVAENETRQLDASLFYGTDNMDEQVEAWRIERTSTDTAADTAWNNATDSEGNYTHKNLDKGTALDYAFTQADLTDSNGNVLDSCKFTVYCDTDQVPTSTTVLVSADGEYYTDENDIPYTL